jgi:hypothetical protein
MSSGRALQGLCLDVLHLPARIHFCNRRVFLTEIITGKLLSIYKFVFPSELSEKKLDSDRISVATEASLLRELEQSQDQLPQTFATRVLVVVM